MGLAEPLFGLLLPSPHTQFVGHSCIQEKNTLPRKKMHNYGTTANFSDAHSLQQPSPWLNNREKYKCPIVGQITTVPIAFVYIKCTITSTRATTKKIGVCLISNQVLQKSHIVSIPILSARIRFSLSN